ncbi:unnamed protein product [Mytilus coruscus]|uniref:DUF5641 domain-containing protein n=1 Tax=Mytilus coruscus TaxID=42192 RepID=A0A6J8EL57_MYTCO|nr:unnamed protein product [Mytilus coruscus]
MREGFAKDIENFAYLLDTAVVILKEAGRFEELKNGSLHNQLQRKMTESMLSRYHRWIFESGKIESVECLREWILQESEFQTIASETIHGLSANSSSNSQRNYKGNRKDGFRTLFGELQNENYTEKWESMKHLCKCCNGHYGVWRCDEFRKLTVHKRWDTAKRLQLCYRCLGQDHVGRQCPRSRACNLGGCKEVHNKLLHRDKQSFSEPKVPLRTEPPLRGRSADSKDDTPLTPSHFLHGQLGGHFAPESVDDTNFNPRKRWRRIQELIRHFWKRWIREWLPGLNKRDKWTKTKRDIKTDDIVLVMNPNVPRRHWTLGRIIEVFPGKDGHVRVAKVSLGQTVLIRPITKLCPLDIETSENDSDE